MMDGTATQEPLGWQEYELTAREESVSAPAVGLALLTLFFVVQILQLFPALHGLQIAKLTALVVLAMVVMMRHRLASSVRLLSLPHVRCAACLFILALATVPFAVWPAASLEYIADVYAKNLLFVLLLIRVVRGDTEVRMIAVSLVLGCSCLVLAMMGGFGPVVTYEQHPDRVGIGGSYDPNDLALLFVVAIPFAYFMLKSASLPVRLLLGSSLALMILGIIKSGSRGGFLGLVVIGAMILVRGSRQARKYTLATLGVAAILLVFAAPQQYWDRISTIYNYEADYNLSDSGGRIEIWRTGLGMFLSDPLTGVGIDGFAHAHAAASESRLHIAPHNTFLQVGTELGIAGLAIFGFLVLVVIRDARRIRRVNSSDPRSASLHWFASAIEVSMVGFLVSSFFLSHAYSAILCFLVGAGGVLLSRFRAIEIETRTEAEEIEYV